MEGWPQTPDMSHSVTDAARHGRPAEVPYSFCTFRGGNPQMAVAAQIVMFCARHEVNGWPRHVAGRLMRPAGKPDQPAGCQQPDHCLVGRAVTDQVGRRRRASGASAATSTSGALPARESAGDGQPRRRQSRQRFGRRSLPGGIAAWTGSSLHSTMTCLLRLRCWMCYQRGFGPLAESRKSRYSFRWQGTGTLSRRRRPCCRRAPHPARRCSPARRGCPRPRE
jgi:hypothetical protein